MENAVLKIVEDVLNEDVIMPEDVPSIDLYMDQLITLLERKMHVSDNEKTITKAMINNYSKAKIINPIKGKTYSKERIMQILMISTLKNSLNMQQMKTVMQTMYQDLALDEEGFVSIYRRYLEYREKEKLFFPAAIESTLSEYDTSNKEDVFTILLCICAMSDQLSKVADKLVSTYFDNPNEK